MEMKINNSNLNTLLNVDKIKYAKQIGTHNTENPNGTININVPIVEMEEYGFKPKGCAFILVLETGQRGYYPGAKLVCEVRDAYIKSQPNDESEVLAHVENTELNVIDMNYNSSITTWLLVEYENIHGYIYLPNINYTLTWR